MNQPLQHEPTSPGQFPPRSKLFVPGIRPELFSKALASEADAVCFDLEDAVTPARKAAARNNVRESLSSSHSVKQIIVRVNGIRSEYFIEDIAAIVCPALSTIALPKTEDPSEIEELALALSHLEAQQNILRPIAILPTIESPRGLRQARVIAEASPRIAGLQLGLADLFYSLGIQSDDSLASHHVRMQLRLAAAEANVPCFDSAFLDLRDNDRFAAEATAAHGLGFSGKSCIHPRQVPMANQIFSPTAEEVALSFRIVEAARAAARSGVGVFELDGRVIDEPVVKHAARILELANRTGPDSTITR